MPPNNMLRDDSILEEAELKLEKLVAPQAGPWKYKILYLQLISLTYWYIAGVYGLYLFITSAKWATIIFNFIQFIFGHIGISAGAHRLWSHRAFKVNLPLEILLIVFNSIGYHNSVTHWVRDHRLHHRYSDTDADPTNASRGLFFSHIGWLLVKKHDEVKKRGKYTNMSDIYSNPLLRFQDKYKIPIFLITCLFLPTVIPMYFWGETLNNAWHTAMFRHFMNLNTIFLVNSIGHTWGRRPYDKGMLPTENSIVGKLTLGEGFHNYHHTFPWDYRSTELGNDSFSVATMFIDFFAWVGWAYDLKTASNEVVKRRMKRTGDGTGLLRESPVEKGN